MAESGERYDLIEPIASGGMGEVFRAEVRGAHGFVRPVAIKRIRRELARSPELLLRFVAEAKTSVSLMHANVVQVLDLCRAGDDLYIVMELVDGVDLGYLFSAQSKRKQTMPIATVLYLAIEALKALTYAHERGGVGQGVVHCDISPSNLLISRSGEVKITDFGIAQSLRRSVQGAGGAPIMGKLRYMAPEQLRGEALDERADLYGLGVVLYECLTLKPLFVTRGKQRDDEEIVQAALHEVPPSVSTLRDGVPSALAALIDSALAKSPGARPRRARDMLQAVTRIVHSVGALVTAPEVGAWVMQLSEDRARDAVPAYEPTAAPGDVPAPRPRDPKREDVTLEERRVPRASELASSMHARPRTLTYTGRRTEDGLLLLDEQDLQPLEERAPLELSEEISPPRVARGRSIAAGALLAGGVLVAIYGLRSTGGPAERPVAAAPAPPPAAAPAPAAVLDPIPTPAASTPHLEPPSAAPTALAVSARPRPARPSAPASETKAGTLNVYAEPWANATLDGKSIGTTPIVDLRVPAGEHVLRLRNPSSRPYERRVRIRPGARELVSIDLEPQR